MDLAPYLNNQSTTSQYTLRMNQVDPAALVLSESSRPSTPSTESGLSTPKLDMSSPFTSMKSTDQDTLYPFLIDSFSRSLSLSPMTDVSSALPTSSSSSWSSLTSAKSTPSPANRVPAYYGLFMADGAVYHFDGTSLVQAPMSRVPTTIEPSLLETMSLVDGSTATQNAEYGYLQVSPLVVGHFQGTHSSLSSSFGPGMLPHTAHVHTPSLMKDYSTMFSNHPTEYPQVPTLIAGLRQDISLTNPSSSSTLSSSTIFSSSSSSTSSSSLPTFTASPLEILASLKPSAFKHSLPSSSSSSPASSTFLPKQPRPSRSATAKSSRRSTRHQQQKKDLHRSSTSSSSSSSSSSCLQGSTSTIPTRATVVRTTRTTKPSGPRLTAKFPCPFAGCDYRYNLKRELNRHKNIHLFEDKDKYQCLHCNAGLCRLDSVKRHMEAKGKSACLEYGLYREFKPNGEVKRIRKYSLYIFTL
ncbi:hypothetical protein BG000_000331 [Podila horticola]|nr:hypothetical protein BG000_000331 [Podila horticola]